MKRNVYSIKQVADMLGMPPVTIRAWENRYEAVKPERTASGYRLYSLRDLEDLRWLKEQTEKHGLSISRAVRLLKDGRRAPLMETPRVAEAPEDREVQPGDAYGELRNQIYDALLAFQGERARALIDFGFSLYGYEKMFHEVLAPVLVKVGDAWESGEATVAQEHYMTHMIMNRFYQFFHVFPVNERLPKALVFCPAGEQHQVGLLLFSLFLRRNGMEVIYLGADTPEEGILSMLDGRPGIGLVCLSLTGRQHLRYAEDLLRRLRRRYPELIFATGGRAYEQEGRTGADYLLGRLPGEWQQWFDSLWDRS